MSLGEPRGPGGSRIEQLPSEILLGVASQLSARDVARLRRASRRSSKVFSSDAIWRERCRDVLRRSPPFWSPNVSHAENIPAPWSLAFDPVMAMRITRIRGSLGKWPIDPSREVAKSAQYDSNWGTAQELPSLASFPGATSYLDVFRRFIHPYGRLLGWWLSDAPSFGMAIRVVYSAGSNNPSPDISDAGDGAGPSVSGPTFICQKIHIVNRLADTQEPSARGAWLAASGVNARASAQVGPDGTSVETPFANVDVAYHGVKTEPLWTATWSDAGALATSNQETSSVVASAHWKGFSAPPPSERISFIHQSLLPAGELSPETPSIVDLARSLFVQLDRTNLHRLNTDMLFRVLQGIDMHLGRPGGTGRPRFAFRQERNSHIHEVYVISGAACTRRKHSQATSADSQGNDRVTIIVHPLQPYTNSSTGLGNLDMDSSPLPPIDFPPPSLLPLIRTDLDAEDDDNKKYNENSVSVNVIDAARPQQKARKASAYDRFLQDGRLLELPALMMDPSPPYKLYPHLTEPRASGPRFYPVKGPPAQPLGPRPTHAMPMTDATLRSVGKGNDELGYHHPAQIPSQLDPGSDVFDWSYLEGLYAMTYGPWGQELIYVRTRQLTVHDFAPDDPVALEHVAAVGASKAVGTPPTGPHGLGHELNPSGRGLLERARWNAEPYIQSCHPQSEYERWLFVRPGCRVVEGIKCTGDANVPRGAVTFRAFAQAGTLDPRLEYMAPPSDAAFHPPWNGMNFGVPPAHSGGNELSSSRRRSGVDGEDDDDDGYEDVDETELSNEAHARTAELVSGERMREWEGVSHLGGPTPGRVLEHGVGRIAQDGFANGGSFHGCSVMIASADEIRVYWSELGKIAVAKRLTAC